VGNSRRRLWWCSSVVASHTPLSAVWSRLSRRIRIKTILSAHGFLRAANGTFTTFDPLGSIDTQPFSINAGGAITGFYIDASFVFHGFLRGANGTFITFGPPGAINIFPMSVNSEREITGWYTDASFRRHGFLRTQCGESDQGDENCEE
jgi:hypothetical protein